MMTASEYRAALAALDMTQVGAARVFGMAERSSRRFADATRDIPWSVEMLLRLMLAKDIPVSELEKAPKQDRMPCSVRQVFYLLETRQITAEEALMLGLGLRSHQRGGRKC